MRGSAATRGGIACEVSRVGVSSLPGWRARSRGYRVDLLADIVSSGAGAQVVRRWFTCRASVVTHPCVTECGAGHPWSSYQGRRDPVRDQSGAVVDRQGRRCWRGWTYQWPPLDMASTACAHGCDPQFTCRSSRRVAAVSRHGHFGRLTRTGMDRRQTTRPERGFDATTKLRARRQRQPVDRRNDRRPLRSHRSPVPDSARSPASPRAPSPPRSAR